MRRVFAIGATFKTPAALDDGDFCECLAPTDLQPGELLEASWLGGPRDGERLGYFRGSATDWGLTGLELDMVPVEECTAEGVEMPPSRPPSERDRQQRWMRRCEGRAADVGTRAALASPIATRAARSRSATSAPGAGRSRSTRCPAARSTRRPCRSRSTGSEKRRPASAAAPPARSSPLGARLPLPGRRRVADVLPVPALPRVLAPANRSRMGGGVSARNGKPHMPSHALWYAGGGVDVFPVNDRKAPLTPAGTPEKPGGFHYATTDREQVERWWKQWPDAGIGTPVYDALDVDLYKPECAPTWKRIRPLIPKGTPQNRDRARWSAVHLRSGDADRRRLYRARRRQALRLAELHHPSALVRSRRPLRGRRQRYDAEAEAGAGLRDIGRRQRLRAVALEDGRGREDPRGAQQERMVASRRGPPHAAAGDRPRARARARSVLGERELRRQPHRD